VFEILVPFRDLPEATYVLDVVFAEWLGLSYRLTQQSVGDAVVIRHNGSEIHVACPLLKQMATSQGCFIPPPSPPLACLDSRRLADNVLTVEPMIPILFGATDVTIGVGRIDIAADLFGGIFYLISRAEEFNTTALDEFGRFNGYASVAYACGFHERPLADEYVELLWSAISRLWPQTRRRIRTFRREISCDVDHPYSAARTSARLLARHAAREVVHHRNPNLAIWTIMNYALHCSGSANLAYDHCHHGFNWMLSQADKIGHGPITFYFKAGASNPIHDRDYSLDEPIVAQMLQDTAQRGHSIGLHPSFETYRDPLRVSTEAKTLLRALERLDIRQDSLGGRQHFLRWSTPHTARAYAAAGLAHDSSLGFQEFGGFRCGTCQPFTLFDVELRAKINLIERPLVLMEDAALRRMRLRGTSSALSYMIKFKEICRKFDGHFTLLWHNSNFLHRDDKEIYQALAA
jgi:hypothetical protein